MNLRRIGIFAGLGALVIGLLGAIYVLSAAFDLPSIEDLKKYEPPVTSRVHAGDGQLVAEFATEHRTFVPYEEIPSHLVQAFVSAEDQNFFKHKGVDPKGLLRAMVANVRNVLVGRRLEGASTITQQVAGNMLTGRDRNLRRKIREALTALRIEQTLPKERILELYLNEIYLGKQAYGVAAAALVYFDKPLDELTIAEMAFLGGLPKGPSNYDPAKNLEKATTRRDYVIGRLEEEKYITKAEADAARAEPLVANKGRLKGEAYIAASYFVEELRRDLVKRFSEAKLEDLDKGGYSIRSTLNPDMQVAALRTLRATLEDFDRRKGWRGPVATTDINGDWQKALKKNAAPSDMIGWQSAVILGRDSKGDVRIGFADGEKGVLAKAEFDWAKAKKPLKSGDIVYVAPKGKVYALKQLPEVQGAMVALDPHTGRVYALVGGYSFGANQFNRATQAKRQPGSTFKSFVYAAALENGFTPASIFLDTPFVADGKSEGEFYMPENYTKEFYGPSTMRLGLEKSRNVMTARMAQQLGMAPIVEAGRKFGVSDNLEPVLSTALGSGETTVMRMTAAYAVFANGGRKVTPTLLDRVQDRYGRTVYTNDKRECAGCDGIWSGQAPPILADNREQVTDPITAYQVTSMLEGVVERGTAMSLKSLGRPIAGKTGTTNDYKDAWFVGYAPDLVVGIWVGYDKPKSLGEGESGGRLAVPMFRDFMSEALKGVPPQAFRIPTGVSLVTIDLKTGGLPSASTTTTITEAFKPGTEPLTAGATELFSYGASPGAEGAVPAVPGAPAAPPADDLGGVY